MIGRAARRAARARRLLRAGRPLPAALVAADDRGSGARRRRARGHRRLPAARAGGDGGGARGGVTRLFRVGGAHAIAALAYGTATIRGWTRSSARATATSRRPRRCVAATAPSTSTPGPTEIVDRRRRAGGPPSGSPPTSSRRPSTIPTRGRFSSPGAARWPTRVADAGRGRPAGRPIVKQSLAAHGAVDRRRRRRTRRWRWRTASRPSTWSSTRGARCGGRSRAGAVFVGPFTAQAAGDYATGSNHVLPTAGAARFRGGLSARRFRARDVGAAPDARRARAAWRRRSCRSPAPKGSRPTRNRSRCDCAERA